MENEEKIVSYYKWCKKCKHRDLAEDCDPCHECLNTPININSRKPVKFIPRSGVYRANGKIKK